MAKPFEAECSETIQKLFYLSLCQALTCYLVWAPSQAGLSPTCPSAAKQWKSDVHAKI